MSGAWTHAPPLLQSIPVPLVETPLTLLEINYEWNLALAKKANDFITIGGDGQGTTKGHGSNNINDSTLKVTKGDDGTNAGVRCQAYQGALRGNQLAKNLQSLQELIANSVKSHLVDHAMTPMKVLKWW